VERELPITPCFDLESESKHGGYIHTVANEIAEAAVAHDCDVIVFEDLTDI
jgi:hypothetical protein